MRTEYLSNGKSSSFHTLMPELLVVLLLVQLQEGGIG